MKLNQIIHEKRKELSLTQGQLADKLGVSTPAVHKWEKGTACPDITLLPALARLLKTDLNTLLSFQEDLTDQEIEAFIEKLDKIVGEQDYKTAFRTAIDKIHEYPTSETLLYSASMYLEGALFLYHVPNPKPYQDTLETFYQRLSSSENPEIREWAACMLISRYRNRNDFASAEELINTLPVSVIDRQEQLAILYTQQGKYADAGKLWEQRIRSGVSQFQNALIQMLDIAVEESRNDDAAFFADICDALSEQFSFPTWMSYNARLELAVKEKDKERCFFVLGQMLPAMKNEGGWPDSRLYQNTDKNPSRFTEKFADTMLDDLLHHEAFAFLREDPSFESFIAETIK